jgi:hypothetical protein
MCRSSNVPKYLKASVESTGNGVGSRNSIPTIVPKTSIDTLSTSRHHPPLRGQPCRSGSQQHKQHVHKVRLEAHLIAVLVGAPS